MWFTKSKGTLTYTFTAISLSTGNFTKLSENLTYSSILCQQIRLSLQAFLPTFGFGAGRTSFSSEDDGVGMAASSGFSCKLAVLVDGATVSFSSFLAWCPMIPAASSFFRSSLTLGVSAAALAAGAELGVGVGLTVCAAVMATCGASMALVGTDMFGPAARWMAGAPTRCCGFIPGKPCCGFIPCGTETQLTMPNVANNAMGSPLVALHSWQKSWLD